MPFAVAESLIARGINPILFALKGVCDPVRVERFRHHWISVGQIGKAVKLFALKTAVIWFLSARWCGRRYPKFASTGIRFMSLAVCGLRSGEGTIICFPESVAFWNRMVSVWWGSRMSPQDLLMPEGRLARAAPDEDAAADIARGREVLHALSPFDIGQAAVVIDGHVVGVEDIEGTDGLLARVARLRAEGRIRAKAGRGVLVKAPKSGQDLRFDLPTIGPRTIRGRARGRPCGDCGRRRQHDYRRTADHDRDSRCCGPFRDRLARVMQARATANVARRLFLIATEKSGDRLGANLMKVLRQRLGGAVQFEGIGGQSMAREGLVSLFPIEELSIIGLAAVAKQLPKILRLIRLTADAVMQSSPDILVIIDSPDFTHRVARRVRARDPSIPIVDYVSPSVWAWLGGRARSMRGYIDHVLALLPFEPDVHGGSAARLAPMSAIR